MFFVPLFINFIVKRSQMDDQTHRDEEPVAYLECLDNTPSPQRPRRQQPQAEYSGQDQPQLHLNWLQDFFMYQQGMEQQYWEKQLQMQAKN